MIKISKKTDCCGCSACSEICPSKCISLNPDQEGYWYPDINESKCIDCGLCEKVCPIQNPQPKRTPLKVYAAYNRDETIRSKSASGGIFTLIAEEVIQKGGVVFGVRFDTLWNVVFDYTETIEDLEAFRRSKYVQAWVGDSYTKVHEFLKTGRLVLFTGTPCQIAGLKSFLRKEYENLLTCDLICEGVPSPKVWRKYLDEEIARQSNKISVLPHSISEKSERFIQVKDISFRNKNNGWKNFSFALTLKITEPKGDGNQITVLPSYINRYSAYMQAMFRYVSLRPICYECPFKCCKSQSDITIADYWGINRLYPEMDDNKGTSMVYINTKKGELYYDIEKTIYKETTYEEAFPYNNIVTSSKKHPKRDYFYSRIDSYTSIIKLLDSISFPLSVRIKNYIKKILKVILPVGVYERLKNNVWKKIKRK